MYNITYVRNMILFDIMNQTIIDNKRNDVINFICRPIISPEQNQTEEFDQYYKNYKEKRIRKI